MQDSGGFLPDKRFKYELNTSSRSGFLGEDSYSKRVGFKSRINTTKRSRIIIGEDFDSQGAQKTVSLNKVELKEFKQNKKSKYEGSLALLDMKKKFRISDGLESLN